MTRIDDDEYRNWDPYTEEPPTVRRTRAYDPLDPYAYDDDWEEGEEEWQ